MEADAILIATPAAGQCSKLHKAAALSHPFLHHHILLLLLNRNIGLYPQEKEKT
ncbi:MAG: hypothetical protein WAM14_05620 [Candidatus Nitrosopolaris sp.]